MKSAIRRRSRVSTQAIAADPKNYSLHFNLALAYSLMGKNAEAIPEYKKTLELKPDLYQAELNLGISLLREKQPAEAAQYLATAAAQNPKEYRPNYYLAAALLGAGDFAKAEQSYTTALAIDPKSPDAELGLAHALAGENKLEDAAAHFRKAAELNAELSRRPSGACQHVRDCQAAGAGHRHLSAISRESRGAGTARRSAAQGRQARRRDRSLQVAVAKSPTEANRAALAEAYLKNNEPGKAQPLVEQILATDPDNFEIRMLHGRLIRDQRKFPEAAAEFERATKLKPDAPQAWSELAGVLVMAENYPPALAALDRIAALHAEKPGHVFLRAIVLDKIRDLKPALESYQRFLQMSQGENPNQEWQARQRVKLLEREIDHK